MNMDELKETERYFRRLGELENYPEVRRERDELKEENLRLEERVSELEGKISDQAGKINGLEAALGEELKRREGAEEKLEFEKDRVKELSADIENLKKEIDSLKLYKVRFTNGKGLTLEQAKTEFIQAYEGEIEKRVKNAIDSEFNARVEKKSSRRAVEKLEVLKREEWPRWYSQNIEPRLRDLESKVKENALKLLVGPWQISCEKCGAVQEVSLVDHVGGLLSLGYTEVECGNPGCKGLVFRHRIKVTLRELVLGAAKLSTISFR